MAYRRRAFKRGGRRTFSRRRSAPARVPKFTLANYAPFNEAAIGVRVPDANTSPSFPFHTTDPIAIGGTVASRIAGGAWNPSIADNYVPFTEGASAVTMPAAFSDALPIAKRSAVIAQCQLVRPVAHGVRIMSPIPPTSATGFVHICLVPNSLRLSTYNYPTTPAQMVDQPGYQRIPLAALTQKPFYIVNNWIDSGAFMYRDPNSEYSSVGNFGVQQSPGLIMCC